MVIEEKDFRLTPINDHSPLFDLELLYTIKPKNKEIREEFKNVAYGVGLDYAIQKIAHFRVNNKHREEAISLVAYIEKFKKELELVKDICKGLK